MGSQAVGIVAYIYFIISIKVDHTQTIQLVGHEAGIPSGSGGMATVAGFILPSGTVGQVGIGGVGRSVGIIIIAIHPHEHAWCCASRERSTRLVGYTTG